VGVPRKIPRPESGIARLTVLENQVVQARAEEREMAVREPRQESLDRLALNVVHRRRLPLELVDQRDGTPTHRFGVLHDSAHLSKYALETIAELA
jgi:hypothetical protein